MTAWISGVLVVVYMLNLDRSHLPENDSEIAAALRLGLSVLLEHIRPAFGRTRATGPKLCLPPLAGSKHYC